MHRALAVVALAGCNQVLGIHGTKPVGDAAADAPPGLCDPLPFDPHRYFSLSGAGRGGYSWADARATCQLYGYDLAVIDANDSAEIPYDCTFSRPDCRSARCARRRARARSVACSPRSATTRY